MYGFIQDISITVPYRYCPMTKINIKYRCRRSRYRLSNNFANCSCVLRFYIVQNCIPIYLKMPKINSKSSRFHNFVLNIDYPVQCPITRYVSKSFHVHLVSTWFLISTHVYYFQINKQFTNSSF